MDPKCKRVGKGNRSNRHLTQRASHTHLPALAAHGAPTTSIPHLVRLHSMLWHLLFLPAFVACRLWCTAHRRTEKQQHSHPLLLPWLTGFGAQHTTALLALSKGAGDEAGVALQQLAPAAPPLRLRPPPPLPSAVRELVAPPEEVLLTQLRSTQAGIVQVRRGSGQGHCNRHFPLKKNNIP